MTTGEVKDFFRAIRKEQSEIIHLNEMIREEETMLLPKAIRYDKDKVQTSPEDLFSKNVAKISDMQQELSQSIVNLRFKRAKAEAMLMELDNTDEREVMRWYYMSLNDRRPYEWEDVASQMHYSKRWILKLHGRALLHLSK